MKPTVRVVLIGATIRSIAVTTQLQDQPLRAANLVGESPCISSLGFLSRLSKDRVDSRVTGWTLLPLVVPGSLKMTR